MGTLYIVATPIGNLEDITHRAARILSSVDAILAEDTRVSMRLLRHLSISKPIRPYHDFNKERVTPAIIESLKEGAAIALISDAGTPGIADPAFYLVRQAIAHGVAIVPIPGPSAFIAALVCSGLPTDRFIFENFLPSGSGKRRKILESFINEKRTVVFYESPHRIIAVLKEMNELFGDIPVVIAREMTKIYEEFLRGTPRSVLAIFEEKKPKGEIVVAFNARYRPAHAQEPPLSAGNAP